MSVQPPPNVDGSNQRSDRAREPRLRGSGSPKRGGRASVGEPFEPSRDCSPTHARLPQVADACALFTAVIGLLAIAGCILDIGPLKRVLPWLAAMKFNTAFGLALAGAALWWRRRVPLRPALGAVVALIGALSLVEYLAGLDLGIDQLLIRDVVASPEAAFPPGRMAPSTALCLLLFGVALLGIGGARSRAGLGRAVELLALAATVIGSLSLVAFPTGAVYLRQWPGFVSMALHTAVAFVVLGVGILCAADGIVVKSLHLRDTGRVLWVGFGVLTCLLATVGIVFTINIQTLAEDVHAQSNIARPRREATLELQNGVLGYGQAVRLAVAGDTQARRVAPDEASDLDRHLATYTALAATPRQQELAARFSEEWREVRTLGATLLEAGHQASPEEQARFAALRMRLQELVKDEMRVEAVDNFEARKSTTLRDLRTTGHLPLLLLVVSVLLALLTSGVVARAVSKQEQVQRLATDQLREADQHKSEFLAVLSHELRNPLAPIRNSLYVLERATPGSDQARRAQAVIDRQVGHLSHLVDDLLDLTRISRNKIRLDLKPVDLNDLVRRTVEDHRSLFEKGEVQIEVAPGPERVSVNGDGTRLAQVIGNLLLNAAKFTGRGGRATVSVSVDLAERQAVIRVSDNGAGIPPELTARLFQPFMQADTTLDRSKGGLGLGLALVRGLVELHGGDISVHSDGLGKGAEFVVRLPLAEGTIVPEVNRGGADQPGRRVLIIEDNIDAADSLRAVLETGRHEVAVAYSGPDGLAKARSFQPEVVLCDIGLPGMDGYDVARALRANQALKGALLVALSGYALPDDLRRAREAGFERHIAKPPSIEQIAQVLADAPSSTFPYQRTELSVNETKT